MITSFNPLLGGFTTLDISDPENLIYLLRWSGNLLKSERFAFLDENGQPGESFDVRRGDFPKPELERWQKTGGAGFKPVGSESVNVAATWRYFSAKNTDCASNSFYLSAPFNFWENNLDDTAPLLAEIVHKFDCIIGDLRLPKVKLWSGTPSKGLISIPHLICFGSPYVELIGLEKLLSAPVFEAKQYYDNAFVLRLFETLVSPESDEWKRMQLSIHNHFGLRYFRDQIDETTSSRSFSVLNLPMAARFLVGALLSSHKERKAKSASGEQLAIPNINWERMRRRSLT
jgi:hypothetical protein